MASGDPPNPVPSAEPEEVEGAAAPVDTAPPGVAREEAAAANDQAVDDDDDAAGRPTGAADPTVEAQVTGIDEGEGVGAGAGPSGGDAEILPPSMTPNIPGIEGMSEEDIGAFMESLDEFTPTVLLSHPFR